MLAKLPRNPFQNRTGLTTHCKGRGDSGDSLLGAAIGDCWRCRPAAERGALGPMESPALNASESRGREGLTQPVPDACPTDGPRSTTCVARLRSPHKFSPVPYFLLCRAIELELKSRLYREATA